MSGIEPYIHKLQKQISTQYTVDQSAVDLLVRFIIKHLSYDMFELWIVISEKENHHTLKTKTLIQAIETLFPLDLVKLSISAGMHSVERYKLFSKNSKYKRYSRSHRAGLEFNSNFFANMLKKKYNRVSNTSVVFFTSVIEFVSTMILENSIEVASCDDRTVINEIYLRRGLFGDNTDPNNVNVWVSGDESLKKLAHNIGFY
jgi:hypothetical protein